MESNLNEFWYLCVGISIGILILMLTPLVLESEKDDWKEVSVISRTEQLVSCEEESETEVSLKFSDGTDWKGCPSTIAFDEIFLLSAQVGDVVYYRYNANYLHGIEWQRR